MNRTRTLALVALGLGALTIVAVPAAMTSAWQGGPVVAEPPEAPAGGVAGLLFQDDDGDGVRDPGERVLPDWEVRLYGTGPLPLQTGTTAEDGTFVFAEIENLAVGATSVEVRFAPVLEGPAAEHLPEPTALSQRVTVDLGASATVAVGSFRLCLTIDACGALDLPNLVPLLTSAGGDDYPPPTETRLDTETLPGRTLLRFATSTANLGGVLHVVGGPTRDDAQEIRQLVYGPGVAVDRSAGTFAYHPEHHHVHVDAFVRYELVDASGQIVADSSKVSFCLTDIQEVDAPARDTDPGVFLDLPPLECGAAEQGINPGRADYYGPDLPDQWIDVTDVAPGLYTLRLTVNPDRFLLESDYDDNVVGFPVTLP